MTLSAAEVEEAEQKVEMAIGCFGDAMEVRSG